MIPLRRFRSPAVISLSFCLMAGPGAAVELDPVPHRVNAAIPKTESGPVEGAVVDNSGAVTLSIPIDTPVGSGGFEPELALQYSSQSGDGYAGIGWRLNLSEIRRTTRFGVYGAHATPPNALYYEPFELDGELLVAVGGGEYRTRQESFARITNSGTTWEVVYPNGTKARYGTRPNTVINNIVYGSASRWLRSELEDANGNTIYFDSRPARARARRADRGGGRLRSFSRSRHRPKFNSGRDIPLPQPTSRFAPSGTASISSAE